MTLTKDELHAKAVAGETITDTIVSDLAQAEVPEGGNPPAGGAAAKAQSLHDKQLHLKDVLEEVTAKDESELTKDDASRVMSAESRAMDGIRPPAGSTSAHIHSVADHNAQKQEAQGEDKTE